MELPKRKQNRLAEYDYRTPNAYFITVCTENRKNLFWKDVGAVSDRPYGDEWGLRAVADRPYNINGS